MDKEKIFVSGLYSKEVPATAPDWVLAKLTLNIEQLTKWMEEHKSYADEGGYLRVTILKSKSTGKRYAELDTWKPNNGEVEAKDVPPQLPKVEVDLP